MTSYCEKITGEPFNWFEALEEAMICEVSEGFKVMLDEKSCSWVTCAVGNQCDIIPRRYETLPEGESFETIVRGTENAPPVDQELADLGIRFMFEVCARSYTAAIKTLEKIEERSSVLITEILGNG